MGESRVAGADNDTELPTVEVWHCCWVGVPERFAPSVASTGRHGHVYSMAWADRQGGAPARPRPARCVVVLVVAPLAALGT